MRKLSECVPDAGEDGKVVYDLNTDKSIELLHALTPEEIFHFNKVLTEAQPLEHHEKDGKYEMYVMATPMLTHDGAVVELTADINILKRLGKNIQHNRIFSTGPIPRGKSVLVPQQIPNKDDRPKRQYVAVITYPAPGKTNTESASSDAMPTKPSNNAIESKSSSRTWTSLSGHTIEAELVTHDATWVHLRSADGKDIRIQRNRLSQEDMDFLNDPF